MTQLKSSIWICAALLGTRKTLLRTLWVLPNPARLKETPQVSQSLLLLPVLTLQKAVERCLFLWDLVEKALKWSAKRIAPQRVKTGYWPWQPNGRLRTRLHEVPRPRPPPPGDRVERRPQARSPLLPAPCGKSVHTSIESPKMTTVVQNSQQNCRF